MADPFDLDKDVEAFFNSGGEMPQGLTPEPAVVPPATPEPPAQQATPQPDPGAVPPAPPAEDPALLALRTQLGQLQGYAGQLERSIQEMQKKSATPEEPAPDKEVDPVGHMMHEMAEMKKVISQVAEKISQAEATQAQTHQLQGFVTEIQGMTNAFLAKQPDYGKAYEYLRSVRTQDMRDLGVAPGQINEMLLKEEMAVAASALRQGMNPAQMVYNIAKRYGYQPAPAPVTPNQMANLQKGAAAAPTPVDKAGAHVDISLDAVKDMTADQLDKLVESKDLWAKIVGGKPEGDSIFH